MVARVQPKQEHDSPLIAVALIIDKKAWPTFVVVSVVSHHCNCLLHKRSPSHCPIEYYILLLIHCRKQTSMTFTIATSVFQTISDSSLILYKRVSWRSTDVQKQSRLCLVCSGLTHFTKRSTLIRAWECTSASKLMLLKAGLTPLLGSQVSCTIF